MSKDIIEELNDLVRDIPYELKDCFGIFIPIEKGNELIERFEKQEANFFEKQEEINFPITYKGVIVALSEYKYTRIEVIYDNISIKKVFNYEIGNVKRYLKELEELCRKYKCNIDGCGCCGSPYISNLYTITIDNINYENNKLHYDLKIKSDYRKIIEGEYGV